MSITNQGHSSNKRCDQRGAAPKVTNSWLAIAVLSAFLIIVSGGNVDGPVFSMGDEYEEPPRPSGRSQGENENLRGPCIVEVNNGLEEPHIKVMHKSMPAS